MSQYRKPPIGSRPGTLAIDPDALAPRVRAVEYDEAFLRESEPDLDALRELKRQGRKLWVDVQGLGDAEALRAIAEIFSIHPLALEDVVHVPIRPKAEVFGGNLLIVTRMIRSESDGRPDIEQVSILVGRGYVVTFQERYGDVLDPVRQRLRVEGSMIRRSPSDYLGYAILDTIVDAYFPIVELIGDRIEGLEDRVLTVASTENLQELNAIKGQLLTLRRAITPQRDAINSLVRGDSELVSQAVRVYLRDTHDHVIQTSEAVESARELVNGLMNTFLSVVSNRMNEVMKTLTIVASLFVPLTFLAGIYGMNFEHMPELGLRWSYPALLLVMGVAAIAMILYFWRKGWIGRRS